MPLAPGTRLGPYDVVAAIGAGGMGEVYRARDTTLGREVAIKVLPGLQSQGPDRLRRFQQEARAAAALNHPNILAVFQLGTHEGAPYLVSELLEGGTLREQLMRGRMPLRKAIDCGIQVAHGLAAAHEKGIVHRDLKPENLFVTRDGRVKILDFGLAKLTAPATASERTVSAAAEGTEPGMVMGTVGYMSPEQVRGEKADHRSDIFALGAILYEMLTGQRAFRKATSAETMSAILNEDPAAVSQILPTTPPALQKIVHRCLEKNPEQRFQSASDLAFALEALSDSGSSPHSVINSGSSRRVSSWIAVAVLVALALGVGAMLWLKPSGAPTDRSLWVQLTNFPDSVTQPALSPDDRMLTFVRGSSTFAAPGEIYIKILPSGQPVQLTHDNLPKMSPIFSPDGSRIAYTAITGFSWDTWVVPVLGGQPERWLPNASGLAWVGPEHVIFSEVKSGEHMAIVTSTESRGDSRDIYVPARQRGMAHRSYVSPDGRWTLLVEMDNGEWLPCRVVPFQGGSPGRSVGLADAPCTSAAWSPNGKWIYLSLHGKDNNFHIWRQRFPDGRPQQITSGPTEEEGIALAADGRSLITSVGLRERTVSVHSGNNDRRISLEGYAYWPSFSPDGKKVYYRVLKGGTSPFLGASELWVADVASGRNEPLLPGIAVTGYDLSSDGAHVVFSANDSAGNPRLWIAPTDRSQVPRPIPNADGDMPHFLRPGEVVFHAIEKGSTLGFRIREDGTGKQTLTSTAINQIQGVSPDGKFVIGWNQAIGTQGTAAFPSSGGAPLPIFDRICILRWQPDRKLLYLSVSTGMQSAGAFGRTYVIPLPPNTLFPAMPRDGFHSEAEIARLPGVRVIEAADVFPGPTPGTYAYSRETVQRNLYRVPLP